jgi:hypothetical protein
MFPMHTRTFHFQGASGQGHHALARRVGRQCSQYLHGVRTGIYSVSTVQHQHYDHSLGTATV